MDSLSCIILLCVVVWLKTERADVIQHVREWSKAVWCRSGSARSGDDAQAAPIPDQGTGQQW